MTDGSNQTYVGFLLHVELHTHTHPFLSFLPGTFLFLFCTEVQLQQVGYKGQWLQHRTLSWRMWDWIPSGKGRNWPWESCFLCDTALSTLVADELFQEKHFLGNCISALSCWLCGASFKDMAGPNPTEGLCGGSQSFLFFFRLEAKEGWSSLALVEPWQKQICSISGLIVRKRQ